MTQGFMLGFHTMWFASWVFVGGVLAVAAVAAIAWVAGTAVTVVLEKLGIAP